MPGKKVLQKITWSTLTNGQTWQGQYPEISVLPAKETHIVTYLLNLFQTSKSYSTIRLTYQAINYFHSIVGHPKVCYSKFFLNILEGIKLITRYTVQKKSPITVKHLYKLCSHLGGKHMSLANLCTALICIFSSPGFLRFSEAINIRQTYVVIKNTNNAIFIEKSKTDFCLVGS